MPYLTVDEYVARFGARETGTFTNTEAPTAPGTFDEPKVETAIGDACDEIDAYVGLRYATPLSSAPTIVKGWVADIARLKLATATGRVSQPITDAANRATGQLMALVNGKLSLPIEEGSTAPTPSDASGSPTIANDRDAPLFGYCGLGGFMSPFIGCTNDVPAWRRGG